MACWIDSDGWIYTDIQTLIDTDKHLHSRQMDRAEQTDGQIRPDINKTDRQLDKTDTQIEWQAQPDRRYWHNNIDKTDRCRQTGMEIERYTTTISNTRNVFYPYSYVSLWIAYWFIYDAQAGNESGAPIRRQVNSVAFTAPPSALHSAPGSILRLNT